MNRKLFQQALVQCRQVGTDQLRATGATEEVIQTFSAIVDGNIRLLDVPEEQFQTELVVADIFTGVLAAQLAMNDAMVKMSIAVASASPDGEFATQFRQELKRAMDKIAGPAPTASQAAHEFRVGDQFMIRPGAPDWPQVLADRHGRGPFTVSGMAGPGDESGCLRFTTPEMPESQGYWYVHPKDCVPYQEPRHEFKLGDSFTILRGAESWSESQGHAFGYGPFVVASITGQGDDQALELRASDLHSGTALYRVKAKDCVPYRDPEPRHIFAIGEQFTVREDCARWKGGLANDYGCGPFTVSGIAGTYERMELRFLTPNMPERHAYWWVYAEDCDPYVERSQSTENAPPVPEEVAPFNEECVIRVPDGVNPELFVDKGVKS